jgi:alanyl-tRNA synthetase
MKEGDLIYIAGVVINEYRDIYSNLFEKGEEIKEVINDEEKRFRVTLKKGLKQFEKLGKDISAKEAFDLYQTYGFPAELTEEMIKEKGGGVDLEGFQEELEKHSELSSTAAVGKFKGGLAGHGEMETKYHTTTHLLLAALNEVLGGNVEQRGSNITEKRLRFDFSYPNKLNDEEKQAVENLVNKKIKENLKITWEEMTMDEAKNIGAHGIFEDKYGDKVKVYKMGDFSLEICGGPHVESTGVLGKFKILKESSSSAGIRRIKAVLE